MPSLFDPVALELGFKKIFGIIFAGTTLTLLYLFHSSNPSHLDSALLRDVLNWWNASTIPVRAIGVISACALYIGIVFCGTLTVYDYLLAKQSAERPTKDSM
jgi:hypothetical protein